MTNFAWARRVNRASSGLGSTRRLSRVLGRDWGLGYLMLAPLAAILLGLVAHPFLSSLLLSMQAKDIAGTAKFVGFENYRTLWTSSLFPVVIRNTFVYTVVGVLCKFMLGMTMALILNQEMKLRNVVRALVLLTWSAPVVVGCFTWRWILDGMNGVLNYLLIRVGLIDHAIQWLSDPKIALWSVLLVVVWQGTPFYILNFLAGLSSIDDALYEAAAIDGAGTVRRFLHVTLPCLQPVIVVTALMSSIFTSNEVQFVFILTNGGPANATTTFPMLAYNTALRGGQLGMGAAVALSFVPFLLPLILLLTMRLFRQER